MERLTTKKGRFFAHLEAWFIDHEILRTLYRNFYSLSNNAYRSNHPSPSFIKKLRKNKQLKTIISMRRADSTGQYRLEKETCDKLGITLINHPMSSRSFPDADNIIKAKEILENADYPILIHCKSGADRAGMMSVFYKHFILNQPIKEALAELSMKYGHFRWADTGKLDVFFEDFLKFEQQNPEVSFIDWVKNHYNKPKLNEEFHAEGWANIVVNKILKRE
jgi:protein tyrosine/serine phosphatase